MLNETFPVIFKHCVHVGVVDDATFLLEFEDYFYLIEIHLPRSVLRRGIVNNNHAKHDAVFQVGILILW